MLRDSQRGTTSYNIDIVDLDTHRDIDIDIHCTYNPGPRGLPLIFRSVKFWFLLWAVMWCRGQFVVVFFCLVLLTDWHGACYCSLGRWSSWKQWRDSREGMGTAGLMRWMMSSPTWNVGCIQVCHLCLWHCANANDVYCFHALMPDSWVPCKDVDTMFLFWPLKPGFSCVRTVWPRSMGGMQCTIARHHMHLGY